MKRSQHLGGGIGLGVGASSLLCWIVLWVFGAAGGLAAQEAGSGRDLFADTWVGHDALGRNLPTYSVVGPVKRDHRRVVGIFYITWHRDSLHNLKSPYSADVSRVLARDPRARLDARNPLWTEGSYHWGEPENGYFLSRDEYVIRQDMAMLADAGVDVLLMDVTNAVRVLGGMGDDICGHGKDEGRGQPRAAVLLLGI